MNEEQERPIKWRVIGEDGMEYGAYVGEYLPIECEEYDKVRRERDDLRRQVADLEELLRREEARG